MRLKAIANHIIFVFEDKFVKRAYDGGKKSDKERHFVEKTGWGFEFATTQESLNNARWGISLATGPLCDKEIQPGMRILIEPLKWTNGVQIADDWFWRTNDENVLAIDDDFSIEKLKSK